MTWPVAEATATPMITVRRFMMAGGYHLAPPTEKRPLPCLHGSAVTRQVSEGAKDLRRSTVSDLSPQTHRIAAFGADRVSPRADQIPHDFGRDLGVELHRRDRLGKPERLGRAGLVGGQKLRSFRDPIDHIDVGLLHRDLALLRPGEERVPASFRRELHANGADLAALRVAHDARAARSSEQLVSEANSQDGNARRPEAQETIAEFVHPRLGRGERERRTGDDDALRLRGELGEALA